MERAKSRASLQASRAKDVPCLVVGVGTTIGGFIPEPPKAGTDDVAARAADPLGARSRVAGDDRERRRRRVTGDSIAKAIARSRTGSSTPRAQARWLARPAGRKRRAVLALSCCRCSVCCASAWCFCKSAPAVSCGCNRPARPRPRHRLGADALIECDRSPHAAAALLFGSASARWSIRVGWLRGFRLIFGASTAAAGGRCSLELKRVTNRSRAGTESTPIRSESIFGKRRDRDEREQAMTMPTIRRGRCGGVDGTAYAPADENPEKRGPDRTERRRSETPTAQKTADADGGERPRCGDDDESDRQRGELQPLGPQPGTAPRDAARIAMRRAHEPGATVSEKMNGAQRVGTVS